MTFREGDDRGVGVEGGSRWERLTEAYHRYDRSLSMMAIGLYAERVVAIDDSFEKSFNRKMAEEMSLIIVGAFPVGMVALLLTPVDLAIVAVDLIKFICKQKEEYF